MITILSSSDCLAQFTPPDIVWNKSHGDFNYEAGYDFIIDSQNNSIYLSGIDGDIIAGGGDRDATLDQIDYTTGDFIQNITSLGGSYVDGFNMVFKQPNGDFILVGSVRSKDGDVVGHNNTYFDPSNGWFQDGWVVRINAQGNIIWQLCVGTGYFDSISDAIITSDGNLMISGLTQGSAGNINNPDNTVNAFLMKIDLNGNIINHNVFYCDDVLGIIQEDLFSALTEDNQGNIYALGNSNSTGPCNGNISPPTDGKEIFLIKTDSNLNILAQNRFGGSNVDNADDIEFKNGRLYVGGHSRSTDFDFDNPAVPIWTNSNGLAYRTFVMEIDLNLNLLTNTIIPDEVSTKYDLWLSDLDVLVNGHKIFCGTTNDGPFNMGFIGLLDNTNQLLWFDKFGPNFLEDPNNTTQFFEINVANDYSVVVSGRNQIKTPGLTSTGDILYNNGDYDAWLIKFAPLVLCTPPQPPISIGDHVECEQNPLQALIATAAVGPNEVVVWYDAPIAGNIIPSPTLNSIGSVTYYAEALDTITGCVSLTRTPVTLEILAAPAPPVSGGDQSECELTPIQTLTATASVSAGQSITWYDSASGGTIVSLPELNTVGTITYYAETTDDISGCTSLTRTPVTLEILAAPIASIINNTGTSTLTCNVTLINVTATGGVDYLWSTGENIATIDLSSPGTYSVTVTDSNGCTSSSEITIDQDIIPPVAGITNNTGATELTCNITSINVSATGGVSYVWSTGATSSTIDIVNPGTFSVTVTGVNGCTDIATINITENTIPPNALITNNNGINELSCLDTSIELEASGGGTYLWSNGENTPIITVTSPGIYSVTVTASNGCQDIDEVEITQNITIPNSPISNGDIIECQEQPIQTLTPSASVGINEVLIWYDSPINGSVVVSPELGTIGSITYYAGSINTLSGCSSNDRTPVTLTISERTDPVFNAINPICYGENLEALPTTSINGITGTWFPELDNTQTQSYTFTPDTSQCAWTQELTITVLEGSLAPQGDEQQYFCAIDSPTISDIVINANNVNWYDTVDGEDFLSYDTELYDGMVLYAASYNPNTLCENSSRLAVEISVQGLIEPILPQTITICTTTESTISVIDTNNQNIIWYDSPTQGNQLNSDYIIQSGETLYAASYDLSSGCESTVRTPVEVESLNTALSYFNLVTVDGNYSNRILKIDGIDQFSSNSMLIFNRYGNLVWSGENYNNLDVAFDGYSNVKNSLDQGKALPTGTYFFVLSYPNSCGKSQLKGFLQLDNKQ